MARVTVEDCLEAVDNRFELVLLASKRARQLALEITSPFVPLENDKSTVVALREIADKFIDSSFLTGVKREPKNQDTNATSHEQVTAITEESKEEE